MFFLRLLGTPSLKDQNGLTPPSLGWGKPLALLALLSVRGEARRDEIVDLLWRGVDEAKARNAFRQALHRLRAALGEDIIPQDRELLRLVPGSALIIDLRDFEAAVAAGRVTDAIHLYRGDFLQDVLLDEPAFDQWADQERMRLRGRYRSALEQGTASAQASGDWTAALDLSRRLLDIAPLEENAARTAALARLSAGRRTEARDVLVQFATRLQSELGLTLSGELQAMLGRLDRMPDELSGVPRPTPAADVLPFAGRESELSRLLALWRSTTDDAGTLAFVDGDDGMGKSRLVAELVVAAKSLRRATVLVGREYHGTASLPFASVAEALRPLVRAAGIAGASRHLLAEASRLLPELRDAFDLPAVASIEDEAARVRFFEGIAALIDAAAYEQPVLLVLEDLQHAAASTIDLVAYLVGRLAGSAVMFVLTLRPGTGAQLAARVRALVAARTDPDRTLSITLGPLDSAAVAVAMADAWRDLPAALRARVMEGADGVPARLADLLRRARAGDPLALPPVPVRTIARERLQQLSSSHRRSFLVLALLGRPAAVATLAAMAHLSEAAAGETVDILESSGMATRRDGMVVADPVHGEVALEAAGQSSRAFLAGWIAEALTSDRAANPAEIARFFALAGRARETFDASRRAALAAMRVGAWPEAVQHLQVARSVAGDQQVAEIEGLLSALGAGYARIAPARPPGAAAVPHHAEPAVPLARAAGAPKPWHERWFPNWRILFGAALGTLVISAVVTWTAPVRATRPSLDTLVLAEGDDGRTVRLAAGDLVSGFSMTGPVAAIEAAPAWADSLARLRPELAEARPQVLGASPDGRWLLVALARPAPVAPPDLDLVAVHLDSDASVALDTAAHRSVTEAAWSPDGSRVAWVARMGDERQQEVFTAFANGGGAANVTRHPADDYHIAWSGDGELLGFTSMRDGNPELYAFGVRERRLWRLTRDPAQDDWARFSPSGRLVAFESTRGGESGVYVMAALGGEPVRVGAGAPVSVRDWRGGATRYLNRLRLDATARPGGDTVVLEAVGLDQFGNSVDVADVEIDVLDRQRASLMTGAASGAWLVVGREPGLARVAASVGGWRVDTILLRIGTTPMVLADGAPSAERWRALGFPLPSRTPGGFLLNADGDAESGMLSRDVAPILPGLELAADFQGADTATLGRATLSVALVAPEQAGAIDSLSPQFLRLVSASWDGDARRMIFIAGREVHAVQAPIAEGNALLRVRLRVEGDSTVSFHVGGAQRWRSTVRVVDARGGRRAQGWIGGRATGKLAVTRARVALDSISSP